MKRFFKNLGSVLILMLAWAVVSTMFWGWIMNLVTDTVPAKKLTVFIEADKVDTDGVEDILYDGLSEGLTMVKVHPFSYAFFDSQTLLNSDVFVVKGSNIEQYIGSFEPLPDALKDSGYEYYVSEDGAPLGIKVYDKASGTGILSEYVTYGDEDCYLFIGSSSPHLEDGAALFAAEKLLGAK
ncbi:MAG: hypothetical protein IJS45_09095 [Clostridia bacterium]|nr:hypothetical protein [Clostridia bacterium]